MNRIDNFICNRVLGAWQAVSERAMVRRSKWGRNSQRRHTAGAVAAAAARLCDRGCVLVGGAAIVLALSASPLLAASLTHATGGDGSPTSGGGDGGAAGQAGKDGSS